MSTGVTWVCGDSGLRVRAGADTHTGNYRVRNEDRVHLDARLPLALVLDGMGGEPHGQQVAEFGANAIRDYLHQHYSHTNAAAALAAALRTANDRIRAWHDEAAENRNAGACVVAALVCEGRVHIAWAGDSMAYLVRDGTAKRLTRPHDVRQHMIDSGIMTEAEARDARIRNVLLLYLGCSEFRSDAVSFDPLPGDRLVLATDGVWGLLEGGIAPVCGAAPDPTSCAEALIELALQTNSRDNCTAAVLAFDFPDSAPEPEPPPAPPVAPRRKWRWQFWK